MGIFRRSPSPAVPAGQQHQSSKVHDDTSSKSSTSNDTLDPSRYAASPLQQQRPYHSNPSSTSPSPNPSVDYARSRSPLPSSGSTTTSERYHGDYLSPMRMARDGFIPASSSSASSSPQPGTNSSNASPWAGYLPPEQVTSADKAGSEGRARSKKDKKALQQEYHSSPVPASHGPLASNNTTTLSTPSQPRLAPTSTPTSTQPVEVRKLELSNKEKQRQSELNLARFSINGMLNLVEQRLAQEEKGQPANAGRAHGLGLNVSYGTSRSGVQATPSSSQRTMHTLGEEPAEMEEELLVSRAPQAHQPSPRQRSESAASDATQLRDEVVDLLNLARKASSSTSITIASSTSGSSGSLAGGRTNSDVDMTRSTSSASSVRTGESDLQYLMHTAPFASVKARNAPPGTASREELEELARAVSPFPSSTRQIQPVKPKKKFGIFGGGGGNKKSDESASAIKEVPTSRRAPSPLPPAVLYPDRGPSPCPAIAPEMVSPPAQRSPLHHDAHMPGDARRPPVAGAHRAPVSAQHRRKRSMSVSDAISVAVTQSAGSNMNQSRHLALSGASNSRLNANSNVGIGVRNRPAVYDESYFSNLKTPYYSSLGEGHNKRSSRLARLGIVEHAVENATKGEEEHGEEESLQKAKERLLAQSRTAIGHPSASSPSQKRDAPRAQMSRVVEAQYAIYHADAHKQDLPSASASLSSVGTAFTRSNTATPDSHSSRTSSKKRLGQLVSQDPAGALQFSASNALTAGRSTHQTMWTTPAQPSPSSAASRTNRSNSDASIVDPFLPRGGAPAASSRGSPDSAGGMGRPAQLLVPALHPAPLRHSSSKTEKTYSIGPPPASPLPSPPTAASSVAHSTPSRSISPSQNMTLPPAPSPAPTSPLPPLPAAVCPAPPLLSPPPPGRAPPPVPTQSSVNAGATQGNKEIDYRFELRPHRTKQQGRTKLSPLHERERERSPPLESPSLDKAGLLAPTTTGRLFGSRGIVQRPPSALDMTLLPSPAPSPLSSSTAVSSTSNGSEGLSTSLSSGSMAPTPKAREFNQDQIRRRQETESTLASQYSTEGEYYEGPQGGSYHAGSRTSDTRSGISTSSSSASTTASSAVMDERGYSSSSAGHTTLSSTTSYSSSSMSSYATRPSLSMDGHSVSSCSDDFSSISTHEHGPHLSHSHSQYSQKSQQPYTYVHVNDAVPLKPPRNMSKMTPSPSCESVNNLAGIGLAGASSNVVFPHSRRMHFGWSRHKAMTDLSSHAVGEEEENIHLPEQQQVNNHNSENATSPGSEVDAYAGILGEYEMAGKEQHGQGDDEGYIGSSPEIVSPKLNLYKSHGLPAREKISYNRQAVKHTRSFDQLKACR